MTQKRTKNDMQKVTVDEPHMKSVLAQQPDFLVPVVQEAVQAMLEVEMERASTSAATSAWAIAAGITDDA